MSLDQQDVAATSLQAQSGMGNQFWPIIFDPGNYGAPGGLALNTPVEVSISPCDSIILPGTYDLNYGQNDAQLDDDGTGNPAILPFTNWCGVNIPDILSFNGFGAQTKWSTAAILGLRFNTPNNPWQMWTVGTVMGITGTTWIGGTDGCNTPSGIAGGIRSIAGPISKLWVQIYRYASYNGAFGGTGGPRSYTRTVFLSSLGFTTQISELNGSAVDRSPAVDVPSGVVPPLGGLTSITSGGYVTPQLNSLDRAIIAGKVSVKYEKP